MKAFILKDRGNAVITEQAPAPVLPEPYGAVLAPVAMTPCTSDVNTVYGTGSKKPDNLILGHECLARVLETASGVRDFHPGEIVAVRKRAGEKHSRGVRGEIRCEGRGYDPGAYS